MWTLTLKRIQPICCDNTHAFCTARVGLVFSISRRLQIIKYQFQKNVMFLIWQTIWKCSLKRNNFLSKSASFFLNSLLLLIIFSPIKVHVWDLHITSNFCCMDGCYGWNQWATSYIKRKTISKTMGVKGLFATPWQCVTLFCSHRCLPQKSQNSH